MRRPSAFACGVVLAILVLTLGAVQVGEEVREAGVRVGFRFVDTLGTVVADVTPDGPAERAGLRPGDRLVAVDGTPVATVRDYDATAVRFRHDRPAIFRVERHGTRLDLSITPGIPVDWSPTVLNGLATLAYLALALLILFQSNVDLRAALLAAYAAVVAVELARPTALIDVPWAALASSSLYFIVSGLQLSFELHLVSLIPSRLPAVVRHRWLVPLYYVVGATVAVVGTVATVSGSARVLRFDASEFEFAFGNVALPIWALAVTGVLVHQTLRARTPLARQQASLVLLGEVPWMGHSLVTSALALTGQSVPSWFEGLFPLVVLCFPITVFVAVFRYSLFDIESVVRRSLTYATLTGLLLLVFYGALGASSAIFSRLLTGLPSIAAVSVATLALAVLFTPLRRALQQGIDRRFFPERQAQRQQLSALARDLPALGTVPRMASHLVVEVRRMFQASSVTLFVADPASRAMVTVASTEPKLETTFEQSFLLSADDPALRAVSPSGRPVPLELIATRSPALGQRLGQFRTELVVPMRCGDRLAGILLVGASEGRRRYVAEEHELLGLLGSLSAAVFENVRLFESATRDGLTGLLRREAIVELLERELQRAVRYHRPLAVALIDIDHFKAVNDTHGHLVGDMVLARVARALSGAIRGTDSIGRWGGEEFLAVLPETRLDGGRVVTEKIRRRVAVLRVPADADTTVEVTVSIGVATFPGPDGQPRTTVEAVIAAADEQLRRAKAGGRNRIEPGIG